MSVNEDKNKLIELYAKPGATVEQVQDWIHVSGGEIDGMVEY